MPKLGMRPVRRRDLINATINEIQHAGIGDVTVAQIARRAGVSSALAHHYFGSKEQLLFETMRHLLRSLGEAVSAGTRKTVRPRAALSAILAANFSPAQFSKPVIAAWLAFYVYARNNANCGRLLRIYHRRQLSNLTHYLVPLVGHGRAGDIARGAAAMIDGFYIRCAFAEDIPDVESSVHIIEDYLDTLIADH